MSDIGIGVRLNTLSDSSGAPFVQAALGKVLTEIALEEHSLRLRFADGTGIVLSDEGQSCCESRYVSSDDKLSEFVGAKLQDIDLRDGPVVENCDYDVHEQQFLAVITDRGEFVIVNHNEHNGYYGGFCLVARKL